MISFTDNTGGVAWESRSAVFLGKRDVELLHLIDVVEQKILYPDIENTCLIVPTDGTKLMQAVCKAIRFAYFFCVLSRFSSVRFSIRTFLDTIPAEWQQCRSTVFSYGHKNVGENIRPS